MTPVFADTFYFLALLNRNDVNHAKAVEWTKLVQGMLTTEWVLLELADGLARTRQRQIFGQTRQQLLTAKDCRVLPLDMGLYEEGIQRYSARTDKDWSLTDCLSFVVMEREGIHEALTGDRHFEQAGFVALMK